MSATLVVGVKEPVSSATKPGIWQTHVLMPLVVEITNEIIGEEVIKIEVSIISLRLQHSIKLNRLFISGRSRSGGQGTNFPHPASRFEPLPADHGQLDLSKGTALFVPRTSYIDIKNQNLVLKTIGLISNHYRIRPPTKKCTAFMYDVVITSTRDPVESGAGGSPAGKVSDLAGERMKKGKKKIPKKRNYEIMNQLVKDDSNRTRQVDKLFLNQKKKSPITPIYDGNKIMYTSASLSKDRAKRAVEVSSYQSADELFFLINSDHFHRLM